MILKRMIAGATAGAVGTTALNVVTYLDMAARDRPASSTPTEVVAKLAEKTGGGSPPEENRRQALGSLSGYLTGLGVGAAYGAVQSKLGVRSPALATVVLALAAMAASDVPATLLGAPIPAGGPSRTGCRTSFPIWRSALPPRAPTRH
jgi:hypothetical protein